VFEDVVREWNEDQAGTCVVHDTHQNAEVQANLFKRVNKLGKAEYTAKTSDEVEKYPSEWAISLVKVILGVELIKTVPAELELALHALHELAAARPHNHHVAAWTSLREENLV